MHQSIPLAAMLSLLPSALMACATPDSDADEPVHSARLADVRTAYSTSWGTRTILARDEPDGTYVAQLTWKENGDCRQTQLVMELVPATDTTSTLCGALGLVYDAGQVSGGGCVTTTTHQPVNIYRLNWSNWVARELNYRVVDRGPDGDHDSSGWLPATPGNGCLRPN